MNFMLLALLFIIFAAVSSSNCNKMKITATYINPNDAEYLYVATIDASSGQNVIFTSDMTPISTSSNQQLEYHGTQIEVDGKTGVTVATMDSVTYYVHLFFGYGNSGQVDSFPFQGVIDNGTISLARGAIIRDKKVYYGTQHVKNYPKMKVQFSRQCTNLVDDFPILSEIPPRCEYITNTIKYVQNGKIIVKGKFQIDLTPERMSKKVLEISTPSGSRVNYIFNGQKNEFIEIKFDGPFHKYLFEFIFTYKDGNSSTGFTTTSFKVGRLILRKMISLMEEGIPFSSDKKCSTIENMPLLDNGTPPMATNITASSKFCCSRFSVWRDIAEL